MIKLLNPQYLFLSLLCLPCTFLYIKKLSLLKKIVNNEKKAKKYFIKLKIRTLLFSISWCFLCLALSSPIYGFKYIPIQKKGASIIFVMDISNSMKIKDTEISRLATEKYLADYIIQKYNHCAFALVLGKGEGILSIPLTFEYHTLQEDIAKLTPNRMSVSGTNLESALSKAINSFNTERDDMHIIIMFTDGGETKGNVLKLSDAISNSDIMLLIVGVGTKEGGYIEIVDRDGEKIKKHSALNEELLLTLSNNCKNNSTYIDSNSFLSLNSMFELLDKYTFNKEKLTFTKEEVCRSGELSLVALILFFIGILLSYEKNIL